VPRIDSPTNPRVSEVVRDLREGALLAIVSVRSISEALEAGVSPVSVWTEPEALPPDLHARLSAIGTDLIEASPRVIARISGLPSAREVVALVSPLRHKLTGLPFSSGRITLLLDGIQDPGNVGAIIRSAEAFGAEAILLTRGCANPWSQKVLRAAAGSLFRLPVVEDVDVEEAIAWAHAGGGTIAGAEIEGGQPPHSLWFQRPLLVAIGSEGQGISAQLESRLDVRVTIPLHGKTESLNAAVAASVLLYALEPRGIPGAGEATLPRMGPGDR
jgi:TrmH family RNA methyltransferase